MLDKSDVQLCNDTITVAKKECWFCTFRLRTERGTSFSAVSKIDLVENIEFIISSQSTRVSFRRAGLQKMFVNRICRIKVGTCNVFTELLGSHASISHLNSLYKVILIPKICFCRWALQRLGKKMHFPYLCLCAKKSPNQKLRTRKFQNFWKFNPYFKVSKLLIFHIRFTVKSFMRM